MGGDFNLTRDVGKDFGKGRPQLSSRVANSQAGCKREQGLSGRRGAIKKKKKNRLQSKDCRWRVVGKAKALVEFYFVSRNVGLQVLYLTFQVKSSNRGVHGQIWVLDHSGY